MTLPIWQATITDEDGTVQASASVEVRRESDNGLASLFSDRTGSSPISNPMTTGADGFAQFFVTGGEYKITATSAAGTKTWRWVEIQDFGTAATADVTTSNTDTTAGRLLKVGDFGLGAPNLFVNSDFNTYTVNGIYNQSGLGTVNAPSGSGAGNLLVMNYAGNATLRVSQLYIGINGRAWVRGSNVGTWSTWTEIYHTGNTGDLTVNTGNLVIGTSGKGIDFSAAGGSAAGSTSAVLDDYEEGTWTPAITFGGANVGLTYTLRSGRYTKIGNIVSVQIGIDINSKGSSTGSMKVTGLPFPVPVGGYGSHPLAIEMAGFTGLTGAPASAAEENSTTVRLSQSSATGNDAAITDANAGSGYFQISGTYRTS